MKHGLLLSAAGLALALSVPALAQSVEAGRQKAGQCRTCHGLDGIARIPVAPHLAGESAAYIAAQLEAFRSGAREHEIMSVIAAGLSDEDIADLAAWFSGLTIEAVAPSGPDAPPGPPERCVACHGADGLAVLDEAPHLAGENEIYIVTQLKAFRSGKRVHEIMTPIAEALSDEEMRAAARWYAAVEFSASPQE